MPARFDSAVLSERLSLRGLAAAACLGLMLVPVVPSRAAGIDIHGRFCGTPGQQIPIDPSRLPKSPECPSPCHASCPRKYAAIGEDDLYTG